MRGRNFEPAGMVSSCFLLIFVWEGSLFSVSVEVGVITLRIFVSRGRPADHSRSLIKERDCSVEVTLKIQTAGCFKIWDKLICWLGFSCYQSLWHPWSNEERKLLLVGKSFFSYFPVSSQLSEVVSWETDAYSKIITWRRTLDFFLDVQRVVFEMGNSLRLNQVWSLDKVSFAGELVELRQSAEQGKHSLCCWVGFQ